MLLSSLPSALIAGAALSLLATVGGSTSATDPASAVPPSVLIEDPNIRCAATRSTSVAIPFERIYPRAERVVPTEYYALVRGPRMLTVISDSTMWPAVWHAAVDSVTTAPVAFGNAVLVLAATPTYGFGPTEFRVTSIRQCRRTGVVVVTTHETRPRGAVIQLHDRGLDLVRVPGQLLADNPVLFAQHFRLVP